MPDPHSDLIMLVDAISRLSGRLRGAFAPVRTGSPLTEMEHTVLAAVVEAEHAPTVPQIGRALGHPRQVVGKAANRLANEGLIAFIANPDHKRAARLAPTDAGREHQARANARAEAIARSLMEDIDPGHVRKALELLSSIRSGVDAHARKAAK